MITLMLTWFNDFFIKIYKVIYIFKHYSIFFERKLVQTHRSFLPDLTKIKNA